MSDDDYMELLAVWREGSHPIRRPLALAVDILADMHDGEDCLADGGEGCLACECQDLIASALKAYSAEEAK